MMSFIATTTLGVGLGLSGLFIGLYGIVMERHVLSVLLMLELHILLGLLVVGALCPVSWQYLVVIILALGVGEAALGLSVVVKVSRSSGDDRVRLGILAG